MSTPKEKEPKQRELEDHEPGATREQVMDALKQSTKPIKKPAK